MFNFLLNLKFNKKIKATNYLFLLRSIFFLFNYIMSEINYISQHLLNKVEDINLKLSDKSKSILTKKTNDIMTHLRKFDSLNFKKYSELKIGVDYILDTDKDVDITQNSPKTFENTPEILKLLNKMIKTTLKLKKTDGFKQDFNMTIDIYHSHKDDDVILKDNINKLMTRLWNLFKLFIDKNTDSTTCVFKFYLYTNPKTANMNYSGKGYLESLHDRRCFNSTNGLTQNFIPGEINLSISRLEESIGLLTHEFMHLIKLNNATDLGFTTEKYDGAKFWKGEFSLEENSPMNINEIYTNSFATIYHSYLIDKEMDIRNLENIIRNELIYSIINAIRLSKLTNISIKTIYNRKDFKNKMLHSIEFGD